jgi:hypothetical protein
MGEFISIRKGRLLFLMMEWIWKGSRQMNHGLLTNSLWCSNDYRMMSLSLTLFFLGSIYYRLIVNLLGFRPNILVLHILVLHTQLCLIAKYIIRSYFAHFQSLFSLSLLILNMLNISHASFWVQLHNLQLKLLGAQWGWWKWR